MRPFEYLQARRRSRLLDETDTQTQRDPASPSTALNSNRILKRSHRLTFGLSALLAGMALVAAAVFLRGRMLDLYRSGHSAIVNAAVGEPNRTAPVVSLEQRPTAPPVSTPDIRTGSQPVTPAEPTVRSLSAQVDGITIGLKARNVCWIGATLDRERRVERLIQRGEDMTLHARDEVVLRVGDAGALSLTINGLVAMPLGRLGQAVTTRITRANYRQLVGAP